MADTDWGAYPDASTLDAADLLLAQRGAGGINFPLSLLLHRDATGNFRAIGGGISLGNDGSSYASADMGGNVPNFGLGIIGNTVSLAGFTSLQFHTDQKLRAVILDNGNFGIGTAAPATKLGLGSPSSNVDLKIGFNTASGAGLIGLQADNSIIINQQLGQPLILATANAHRLVIEAGGHTRPGADGVFTSGTAANRWSGGFTATAFTVTSDAREKLWITITEDRRAKDRRIARAIFDELGWFQWKDAVAEKGEDGARWHFGPRAQRVWSIVADEGLAPPLVGRGSTQRPDPEWEGPPPPAWLCFDEWPEERSTEAVFSDKLLGPDEKPLQTGAKEVVTRKAGNRFGLRVDQLGLLLDWSLHERLSMLEAA